MHSIRVFLSAFGVLVAAIFATGASWPTYAGEPDFRPEKIIAVTNLDDSGRGSLRAALAETGKRKVEFAIAGEIWLKTPLQIKQPYVIVDGETAPSPGISIMGDKLRVAAHDVVVRHLRIRVGELDGSKPNNRDGISIDSSRNGKRVAYNVIVENCSISWAIDEGLAIWGNGSRHITIRNNIIAETLRQSRHPKGAHSMGLIVGPGSEDILIEGNLFAHNQFRNPAISWNTSTMVVNNLIYNPGNVGLHFYARKGEGPTLVSAVGNVLVAGPDTRSELRSFKKGINPGSKVYFKDNVAKGTVAFNVDERLGRMSAAPAPFVSRPPVWSSKLKPLASSLVFDAVLEQAGSRPFDRDGIDARIVSEVRAGAGGIRDRPADERLQNRALNTKSGSKAAMRKP